MLFMYCTGFNEIFKVEAAVPDYKSGHFIVDDPSSLPQDVKPDEEALLRVQKPPRASNMNLLTPDEERSQAPLPISYALNSMEKEDKMSSQSFYGWLFGKTIFIYTLIILIYAFKREIERSRFGGVLVHLNRYLMKRVCIFLYTELLKSSIALFFYPRSDVCLIHLIVISNAKCVTRCFNLRSPFSYMLLWTFVIYPLRRI